MSTENQTLHNNTSTKTKFVLAVAVESDSSGAVNWYTCSSDAHTAFSKAKANFSDLPGERINLFEVQVPLDAETDAITKLVDEAMTEQEYNPIRTHSTHAAPCKPKNPPLFARTVAHAVEQHMNALESSRIHWASAAGSETSWEPAKLTWPDDKWADIGYLVKQGGSEGYQIWLTHLPSRYEPESLQPLIIIKCLCSFAETFNQAKLVMEFIEKMDPQAMLQQQLAGN